MSDRTATMEERRTASTLEERLKAYRPEEYLDFSDPEVEARMREAIEQGRVGARPRVPGSRRRRGRAARTTMRASTDPSRPERVVGSFPNGGQALADRAIDAATEAFETWKSVPADERAEIAVPGRRHHAPQATRAGGLDVLRGREVVGRGGRRRRRSDRLLRVLRARDAALRIRPVPARPLRARDRRDGLPPARRGRDHPALELSARDPDAA